MSDVIYFLTCFMKLILYLMFLFVAFVVVLKLWLEPVKGVCTCKTKLNNKVALVTGGNSGIGLETARELAKRGAKVIIASRDDKKSGEAVASIIKTTGNTNVEYKHLDLSKFSSVRKFADVFNKKYDRLDILVSNAGCAGLKKRITEDGIDMVMQVNYLGPFMLTNLLLNKLTASKPSRIVVVSSYAYRFAKFDPDDLAGLKSKGYWRIYANSKLCNILWTKALAKRLPNGVTVNALHPGVVRTDIFKRLPSITRAIVLAVIDKVFKTAEEGAQTSIHLCVAPELEHASGDYYSDCVTSNLYKFAKDDGLIEKVWKESKLLTERFFEETKL